MRYLSLILFVVLGFLACKKDAEKGALTLDFTATYGDDPLVLLQTYVTPEGKSIQFSKSDLYLSDIFLAKENGDRVELSAVEFVDLTSVSTSVAKAKEGFKLTFQDIPAGGYTRLGFGLGLNPTQNATAPADYSSDHPMSMDSHYWTAWKSYIFSKTEGFMDTLDNGNFDLGFLYHTGMDELYRTVYVDLPINITASNMQFDINLDHKAILFKPGNSLDIKASPVNHSPTKMPQLTKIMDNMVSSLAIQIQ